MAGLVTDSSGASVPGATVVLTNTTTGATFTTTTGAQGFYRFSEIPPGEGYSVTFTATGFAPFEVKSIYLTVSTVRTQNATLSVGARAEKVEVTASNSEVTIDTSDATVGLTVDVKKLNNLPVQQRSDPTALFTLQPGVTDSGAVTGARVDQNDVTLDGLDVNDLATGGAVQNNTGAGVFSGFSSGTIVAHAPVDSVEEFTGTVAGSQSNTGPSSGGQFQLVTKSGTNSFHGNLNEYHRDPDLVANSWFSNNSIPQVPRNHLIQNQFGGDVGGPILRDKMFFYFDFDQNRIISGQLVQRTVPLDTLRGDCSGCSGPTVGYPVSGGGTNYVNAAGIQGFDPAGIGIDTNWVTGFDARFPHSNNSNSGDGVNSGGYNFNAPDNDNLTTYVGRIDYNLNQSMKLFGRFTISRENAVEAPNEFAGDPVSNPLIDRSYAAVIGHNWVIGANKTNRVFLGETVQKLSFPNAFNPDGSTFFTFGDGADQALASSLYLNPSSQARRIPVPIVGDDFSWTKGTHTYQFGGTFKDIRAHDTTVGDYNTVYEGLGGHVLGLCGPTAGACGTGNPSLRPSDIDQSNTIVWDEAFAFMLGRIGQVNSDYNYNAQAQVLKQLSGDQRNYQYYQTQLYLQDSWRVLPSLTLTYGLTYQWFTVPYEIHGLESVEPIGFDDYVRARVQQSDLGESGPGAVPLIAYYLGGKANGSSAPPLYTPEYRNIAPHFGFAWNPSFDKKLVVNGSGAIVYDRTVIFAIQSLQDAYSYLFQQTKTTSEGNSQDPYNSIRNDPRLDASNGISTVALTPPATPTPPYEPFATTAYCDALGLPTPCGLQDGGAFNETIDPTLKTPYSILYNFGVQRSIPGDMVIKASYVGRLGRRLLAQADAEQVLDFPDQASGQLLSQAFGNVVTAIRQDPDPTHLAAQPWFEDIVSPGLGASLGYANNTQFLASTGLNILFHRGDFADTMQGISSLIPANVGMAAQYSENSFHTNLGFSSYNGLLLTLQKNASHGLQYDLNYTFSHSIDNISFFANSQGDTGIGGGGLICDIIRPRECRANSDYDVRQYLTGDATYELPFGKGKDFLANSGDIANEIVGGWSLSGIVGYHTGFPWQTSTLAFVASYSNDAPAILTGSKSLAAEHLTKTPGAGVNEFADPVTATEQFSGPVGFQIGPRNGERGPGFFNLDLGLGKKFPIVGEKVNLTFRADAFNALNHPNFEVPSQNEFNGYDNTDILEGPGFGQIAFTVSPSGNLNNGARVLQLALRLEF